VEDFMPKINWTSSDINKLFFLKERVSITSLYDYEEKGEIPKAGRIQRGKVSVRNWTTENLPFIGEKLGFLSKSKSKKIICVYTPKGGVLKTAFTYNFARMLALNGIKTIIIGLDFQCSITNYALPRPEFESIEDIPPPPPGLYDFLYKNYEVNDIIAHTNLPTLDIIPESPELLLVDKKLRLETRREYFFVDKFLHHLDNYDVVIFDNSPSWNQLVETALASSNIIISPTGCDYETFVAIKTILNLIFDFQNALKLDWDHFIQVPTLLQKTNVSQQIYAAYLNNQYGNKVVPAYIRRSVTGEDARALQHSVIEHDSKSDLAQDYYDVVKYIWDKINN
jgi:chromosome partitioning protein